MQFSSSSSGYGVRLKTHFLGTLPKHGRGARPRSGRGHEPVRHLSRTQCPPFMLPDTTMLPDIPSSSRTPSCRTPFTALAAIPPPSNRTPVCRTPFTTLAAIPPPSNRTQVRRHSTLEAPEWRNSISKLKTIQHNVYQGTLLREDEYIDHVTTELTEMLTRTQHNTYELHAIAKFVRLFGHFRMCPYNQAFFDAISDALGETRDENLLKIILPSFMWVCGRRHHYPSRLMRQTSQFLLDSLHELTTTDISMLVHSYAKLNHHLPGLVGRVEAWFLERNEMAFENHLPWTLAWAGMVFGEFPREMLVQLLNDEYIEGIP